MKKLATALSCCVSLTACAPPPAELTLPRPDPATFASSIYPVLLADCAFAGCHGDPGRFLRIHGPGRTRLLKETPPYAAATPEELAISYTRASSMLVSEEGVRRSPLLRKPLAVGSGGAQHAGDDPWGAPVYLNKKDPSWEALFFWAITAETEGAAP
jgi:hypothetical protein